MWLQGKVGDLERAALALLWNSAGDQRKSRNTRTNKRTFCVSMNLKQNHQVCGWGRGLWWGKVREGNSKAVDRMQMKFRINWILDLEKKQRTPTQSFDQNTMKGERLQKQPERTREVWVRWLMPVIPFIWQAKKIWRIVVREQLWQKVSEMPSQQIVLSVKEEHACHLSYVGGVCKQEDHRPGHLGQKAWDPTWKIVNEQKGWGCGSSVRALS